MWKILGAESAGRQLKLRNTSSSIVLPVQRRGSYLEVVQEEGGQCSLEKTTLGRCFKSRHSNESQCPMLTSTKSSKQFGKQQKSNLLTQLNLHQVPLATKRS
nr:unnamed protein product [Callosobruchus chinensis]